MMTHDLRVTAFTGVALLTAVSVVRGSDHDIDAAFAASEGVLPVAESVVSNYSIRLSGELAVIDLRSEAEKSGRSPVGAANGVGVAPRFQTMLLVAPEDGVLCDRTTNQAVGEWVVPIRLLEGVCHSSSESNTDFKRNQRLTFF